MKHRVTLPAGVSLPTSMSAAAFVELVNGRVPATDAPKKSSPIRLPKPQKMTKTEENYRDILIREFSVMDGYEVLFEPWSFRLKSGVRYSPDFVVMRGAEIALIVETKGGYRLGSAGRSHMAFKTAISEWPHLRFRYAAKSGQDWIVTNSTP